MFIEPDQIGERLRAARSRRGLSQRKLARLVGVSPSLISQMEAGKVQPSVATLMAGAMMPLALLMAAMFSTSIYFTFRDSFVATPPEDSMGGVDNTQNTDNNP